MSSSSIFEPDQALFDPPADMVDGSERSGIGSTVPVTDTRVVSDTERLGDQLELQAILDFETGGELFSTMNVDGPNKSDKPGRAIDQARITSVLHDAFRHAWSRSADEFFAPLGDVIGEDSLRTGLGFWTGRRRVCDVNTKARWVSPFIQGKNDPYALLVALRGCLESGMNSIDAAVQVAGTVDLSTSNWAPAHDLPIDVRTGKRLDVRNKGQQMANVTMYFYYIAETVSSCIGDFGVAIDSAPPSPSFDDLIGYVRRALSEESPVVFALQEVPIKVVPRLRELCSELGYTVYAADIGSLPCVVTLVKDENVFTGGAGRLMVHPDNAYAHRSIMTCIRVGNTFVAVLNVHSDVGPYRRATTIKFAETCSKLIPTPVPVVMGDLQIGKIDAKDKHSRVFSDMAIDLGVPSLHTTPSIYTKVSESTPNVFCCQMKFNRACGLA